MLGLAVPDEQFAQDVEYILAVQLPLHMDGEALAGEFIDNRQHPEGTTVMRPIHDEVVGPDMVPGRRAKTDA